MQTLNKKALTERICENFAGHKEVFMADVGNFLRKEHIDYKELGYKKLRDLMLALESFTLEDRFADPDSPPYTVVFLPEKGRKRRRAKELPTTRRPFPRRGRVFCSILPGSKRC